MLSKNQSRLLLWTCLISLSLVVAACTASPAQNNEHHAEESEVDHPDEEHEHDQAGDEANRVPNNGAVVRIVSPADGSEIKEGTDLVVKIETDNFALGSEGNHWHIVVDGESRGMITGADYDEVVRALALGRHEISVILSNGAHQELEEGAAITITVVE